METVVIIPSKEKEETKPSMNFGEMMEVIGKPAVIRKPQSPMKQPIEPLPHWLSKMVHRQQSLNKKYEFAHGQFAQAYNEFLSLIDEINLEHGTDFSFQQAVTEYQGFFANDATDELKDEDDED